MKNKLILLFLSSLHCGKCNSKVGDRGFTLIEVIVAIVILSIFILTSLTALVAGLNFKLKAKLNNEATLIINQDLEQFRYIASQVGIETVRSLPTASAISASGTGTTITGTTNLSLIIPIVRNGRDYLSSPSSNPGRILKIGDETTAYTLAAPLPASTDPTVETPTDPSLAVTVDLSKINKNVSTLGLALTLDGSKTSISVADASAFQAGERVVVGPASNGTIFSFVVTSVNANTISFAPLTPTGPTGGQIYPVNTRVVALPTVGEVIPDTSLCTSTTVTAIFDRLLALDAAPNIDPDQPIVPTFNNRSTYRINRKATRVNPTAVAKDPAVTKAQTKVEYSVKDTAFSPTSNLAILTTEVIPSVAFTCP